MRLFGGDGIWGEFVAREQTLRSFCEFERASFALVRFVNTNTE